MTSPKLIAPAHNGLGITDLHTPALGREADRDERPSLLPALTILAPGRTDRISTVPM
ncbi:hypothetical protein ACFCZ5_27890 [Streptomyces microflavus]|uniref:hypothetical protein n=1 Tax=Streptomyces microflavus TaxID=1919 RepID=UPI0035DEBC31